MPIWVPILALAAALVLTVAVSVEDYLDLGLGPIVPAGLGAVIALGAVGALTLRWDLPWIAPTQPHPPERLAGVAVSAHTDCRGRGRGGLARPARKSRHTGRPGGHVPALRRRVVRRRTGRRHLTVGTGYLCPPPLQQQGSRRHLYTATGGHR